MINLGQVGVFYEGVAAPSVTAPHLIWAKVDSGGNLISWNHKIAGVWLPIGNVTIIDALTSFSDADGLSANQGRVLRALIQSNEDDVSLINQSLVNYLLISAKNQVGGYAGIGANGKIDPSVIDLDGLIPKDVWDASAGSAPTATPANKEYWIVNVAGNYSLGGYTSWAVGDRALYINNDWTQIPVAVLNTYNALNQINAGFQLDARQGKVLKDLIDAQALNVAALIAEIVSLKNRLDAVELAQTQFTSDLGDKMDPISTLTGTITSEVFTHASLAGIQLGQLRAYVGGQLLHQTGFITKNTADNFITIPDAFDTTEILVEIYPA